MTWCTSKISPAKRLRLFFQNNIAHDNVDSQALFHDDLRWPDDWKPLAIQERSKPFMRPLEILSDLALRHSWSSYHPSALLWRVSFWQTHDRLVALANMSKDSSVLAFQWSEFLPVIYVQAWRHFLRCFSSKSSSNLDKDAALREVLPLFHDKSIQVPFRFLADQEVLRVSGLSSNFACVQRLKHMLNSNSLALQLDLLKT